jgi:hypothetical protein
MCCLKLHLIVTITGHEFGHLFEKLPYVTEYFTQPSGRQPSWLHWFIVTVNTPRNQIETEFDRNWLAHNPTNLQLSNCTGLSHLIFWPRQILVKFTKVHPRNVLITTRCISWALEFTVTRKNFQIFNFKYNYDTICTGHEVKGLPFRPIFIQNLLLCISQHFSFDATT